MVPSILNAEPLGSLERSEEATVDIGCYEGYAFPDRTRVAVISCIDMVWRNVPETCEGEFKL